MGGSFRHGFGHEVFGPVRLDRLAREQLTILHRADVPLPAVYSVSQRGGFLRSRSYRVLALLLDRTGCGWKAATSWTVQLRISVTSAQPHLGKVRDGRQGEDSLRVANNAAS